MWGCRQVVGIDRRRDRRPADVGDFGFGFSEEDGALSPNQFDQRSLSERDVLPCGADCHGRTLVQGRTKVCSAARAGRTVGVFLPSSNRRGCEGKLNGAPGEDALVHCGTESDACCRAKRSHAGQHEGPQLRLRSRARHLRDSRRPVRAASSGLERHSRCGAPRPPHTRNGPTALAISPR